jgi:hypothetical protein
MPFVHAQLAVEGIDSDLLDQARDVYRQEVGCWRIVGPAIVKGQESWLASRNSEAAFAEQGEMPLADLLKPDLDIEAMEFSERGYAMDFVMWRALGKAIAFYQNNDKPKLIGLS